MMMKQVSITTIPLDELAGKSWQEVLACLTADMDPWSIDIAKLAQRYRSYIASLSQLHYEVSGQMVLTCSILLRMKSDILLEMGRPTERNELLAELEEAVEEAASEWEEPLVPPEFSLPLQRYTRRRVTISDLRIALAYAMKVTRRRIQRHLGEEDEDDLSYLQAEDEDISERLHGLFSTIKQMLSGRNTLSFFRLLRQGDKEERVRKFVEVLHLIAQGKVSCEQQEFLGDILISIEKGV